MVSMWTCYLSAVRGDMKQAEKHYDYAAVSGCRPGWNLRRLLF
jgi:hypothetical protein